MLIAKINVVQLTKNVQNFSKFMLPYTEYVNSKKYWIAKLLCDATTQPFFNIFYLDNDHHELVLIYGIRHYE